MMTLTVEVFSDVVCPWCYIGKRRLEKAIDDLGKEHAVQVRWRPFQLNPHIPKEGLVRSEYRIQKFGSLERSKQLEANVIAAGELEGIPFEFDRIERTPNTLDAHRLIWLADQHGIQDALVEGLFRAYFIEGQDIGNRDKLTDVVAAAGLDRQLSHRSLMSDEGLETMREEMEHARQIGITGVPFFIVNDEITISGAQSAETFLAAFRHSIASV